jgi:Asp-tRNA(Asn)/Glu-tRNA(Gln) amidotransferase A subunit family amidase
MDGVLPFAPSLDTLGFFTASAADMACLWPRVCGTASAGEFRRAAIFDVPAEEPMQRAIGDAVERLRAHGLCIARMDAPPGWDRLVAAARTINEYEGARTHRARYHQFGERMGARLAELIRRGLAAPVDEYAAARAHIEQMRRELARLFREYVFALSPAATGPAPAGLGSTGDPVHNAGWTALGVPAISVPLPVAGAPLGLQITAAAARDDALVSAAAEVERLLRPLQ